MMLCPWFFSWRRERDDESRSTTKHTKSNSSTQFPSPRNLLVRVFESCSLNAGNRNPIKKNAKAFAVCVCVASHACIVTLCNKKEIYDLHNDSTKD